MSTVRGTTCDANPSAWSAPAGDGGIELAAGVVGLQHGPLAPLSMTVLPADVALAWAHRHRLAECHTLPWSMIGCVNVGADIGISDSAGLVGS